MSLKETLHAVIMLTPEPLGFATTRIEITYKLEGHPSVDVMFQTATVVYYDATAFRSAYWYCPCAESPKCSHKRLLGIDSEATDPLRVRVRTMRLQEQLQCRN